MRAGVHTDVFGEGSLIFVSHGRPGLGWRGRRQVSWGHRLVGQHHVDAILVRRSVCLGQGLGGSLGWGGFWLGLLRQFFWFWLGFRLGRFCLGWGLAEEGYGFFLFRGLGHLHQVHVFRQVFDSHDLAMVNLQQPKFARVFVPPQHEALADDIQHFAPDDNSAVGANFQHIPAESQVVRENADALG